MKIISLKMAVPVDGPLRHPSEGAITVTDEVAARLKDSGVLDGEPEDVPEENGGDADHDDDLDGKKVSDLKKLAEDEGVDLGEATLKADIINAIRAHRDAS